MWVAAKELNTGFGKSLETLRLLTLLAKLKGYFLKGYFFIKMFPKQFPCSLLLHRPVEQCLFIQPVGCLAFIGSHRKALTEVYPTQDCWCWLVTFLYLLYLLSYQCLNECYTQLHIVWNLYEGFLNLKTEATAALLFFFPPEVSCCQWSLIRFPLWIHS